MNVRRLLPLLAVLTVAAAPVFGQTPLPRAHAHNDYEHDRPLLDALAQGFMSVEADIHFIGGELRVAHDLVDTRPGRTLERLYLDPLRERVRRNGGTVYPDAPGFILLIDIKSDAEETYAALRTVLRTYADILTIYTPTTRHEGAVTAILSGNRPISTLAAEHLRYAALDGRLPDLTNAPSTPITLMPLVSANWADIERWYGDGPLSTAGQYKLDRAVRLAHNQGRKLRFWATSDDPRVWQVLYDAGVDLLNADDLTGLRRFLEGQEE